MPRFTSAFIVKASYIRIYCCKTAILSHSRGGSAHRRPTAEADGSCSARRQSITVAGKEKVLYGRCTGARGFVVGDGRGSIEDEKIATM